MSETATKFQLPTPTTTVSRVAVSFGMAGLLMLFGAISFPVPWTPVPFSLIPLGLLMAGAVQRAGWGALSVIIYLLAGAMGAPVLAEGESGWRHFAGATAGYLFAFPLVSAMVGAYVRQPRELPSWLRRGLITGFLTSAVAGIAVVAWLWNQDGTLGGDYTLGGSVLWALVWVTAACIAMAVWNLRRTSDHGPALSMWIVMMGAILLLHGVGVTGLWIIGDFALIEAIAYGSIVFLPFDTIKAGLAVAATLPFLPSESNDA
ncbi:MAG: biotin transporter BioY [Thermoplasmatota archaeon]